MELNEKVCPNCGKKLEYNGIQLTEQELEANAYFSNKELAAKQYLNIENLKSMDLDDSQAYQYFKASFDLLAEAYFLKYLWQKEIEKKYKINFGNILIDNEGKLYAHTN